MVTTENFKKCVRGHFYSAELDHCPYCSSNSIGNETKDGGKTSDFDVLGTDDGYKNVNQGGSNRGTKTEIIGGFGNGSRGNSGETLTIDGYTGGSDNNETTDFPRKSNPKPQQPSSNRTMMFDEEESGTDGGHQVIMRDRRKLVGWLISYTLDAMGVDFRLYEGRNIIGRNADCQVTIADKTVSGRHAVILFRSGKYSISDQQSSKGTFVNGEDIELEPRYLQDGDTIRMGQTIFKFRSSL